MFVDEDGLIAAIRRGAPPAHPGQLGIGDDAALLPIRRGFRCVLSVDDHVENVHFRHRWCPPANIGRRAAGAALSDLAAMGARPRGALLSLHVPEAIDSALLEEVSAGIGAKLARHACPLLGGNITRSAGGLALSITVIGEVGWRAELRRNAAEDGDRLWITRLPGTAKVALSYLEGRRPPLDDEVELAIERYLNPEPEIMTGRALSRLAAPLDRSLACLDISDGLARDAARLARASGLTIELDLERIVSPTLSRLASLIEGDAARLALSSGEEYSLLVAAPGALDSELASLGLERIGALRHGPSVVVCSDGTVIDPLSAHDHLSSAKSGDAPSSS